MSEIINNIVKGDIGNALHSVASTHIVTTADEIYDETKQDRQSTINANVDAAIGSDSNPNTIKGRLAAIEARDVTTATYNFTDKTIEFYNVYNTKVAEIDATDFIKDGMVDTVAIVDNNLVITFNTDSGKQSISIPLTSFFDPSQYYNKTDINKLICDVSVLNVVNNQPKTYSSLSDAINDIPTNSRKGGMTLKFINDNDEYEQWSLITDTWSAVISNWRNADDVIRINTAQDLTDAQKATALGNLGISGIDDVPTAGSSNLVKSGGVAESLVPVTSAVGSYDITPTTSGYFYIKPYPILKKGNVMYIYIDEESVVTNNIEVEYADLQTGNYIATIHTFTSDSEKIYKVVVNRDNVTFRIRYRNSLNPLHIRYGISGSVKDYTDVSIPHIDYLLHEDTILNEIVKGNKKTNIIYNDVFSLAVGNRTATVELSLLSSTKYYFYIGGNKDFESLTGLTITLKNSSNTTVYYRNLIETNVNYFTFGGSVYYCFYVDIVSSGTYTLSITKAGIELSGNVIITENIPLPDYVTKDVYKHLRTSTDDYSFGLDWINGGVNGSNNFVLVENMVACLFDGRGSFKINYKDDVYRLRKRDSAGIIEIQNNDTITITDLEEKATLVINKRDSSTFDRDSINDVCLSIRKLKDGSDIELDVPLELGVFYSSGNDTTSDIFMRTPKISCEESDVFVCLYPDNFRVTCNLNNNYVTSRANVSSVSYGFSITKAKDFVRFGFRREDSSSFVETPLTNEERNAIHVYKIPRKTTEHDIVIAAYDSPNKNLADIVCTEDNVQSILNALVGCLGDMSIYLLEGHYNLNRIIYSSISKPCALKTQESITKQNYVRLKGEGKNTTTIRTTQSFFDALPSNSESALFLVPCLNQNDYGLYPRVATNVNIQYLAFRLYNYTKPTVAVDLTFAGEAVVQNCYIRGEYEATDLHTYDTAPNIECVGLRVGHGSNNGIGNKIKSVRSFFFGKGISCNGEHFVFEDVLTHHCYIGWAFGDRKTGGHFEHPNIMIGCSIEGCYRLMYLTKMAETGEGEFVPQSGDANMYISTLICQGLSTETSWAIPEDEIVEGGPTTQTTLPILEVLKGAYRGSIELDYNRIPFETGSGKHFTFRYYNDKTYIGHFNTVDSEI